MARESGAREPYWHILGASSVVAQDLMRVLSAELTGVNISIPNTRTFIRVNTRRFLRKLKSPLVTQVRRNLNVAPVMDRCR